ncbi:MAG: dihydroxyacetone kinase subunit DhaK [Pseudomonadota bacterium]
MKKLINSKDTMVDDMIAGFVAAWPDLVTTGSTGRVIRRRQLRTKGTGGKVALLIGNGSGHEPIAMGFVGEGLLDANAVGDVFTAPSADDILEAVEDVTGEAGAILLISRHEGDVINGNGAALMAQDNGLDVRPLLMYDDISSAPKGQEEDRRGAAGTIFIYKILGAAAEQGMALADLMALGEAVRGATRTLGAALRPGTSPLSGAPMFELPNDEVAIGMGVHGERGAGRRPMGPARDLVRHMVDALLEDRPIAPGTEAIALINGAGGTTMMELLTVYGEVASYLRETDIGLTSPMIGSYSTTQEMGGFSISILVPTPQMLELWRAPHGAPQFPAIHAQGD